MGPNITGGSSGGRLRVDATTALPTTGTVAISTGGRLTLNATGTYGGTNQALTFNPNQTANPALDILSGAAVTWQGTVAINADTRIEANGSNGTLTFSGSVAGSGTLIKQGSGDLILSGTGNALTGATTISAGTVNAAAAGALGNTPSITVNTGGTLLLSGTGNRINDSASLTLAGGTFNLGGNAGNETLGTLTLSGNSAIDFGTLGTATTLRFADSSSTTWGNFTLKIYDWEGNPFTGGGRDQLFFGSGNSGLTSAQLSKITFYPGDGTSTPYSPPSGFAPVAGVSIGEVAPVPEPSAVVACLSLLGLAAYRERRHLGFGSRVARS